MKPTVYMLFIYHYGITELSNSPSGAENYVHCKPKRGTASLSQRLRLLSFLINFANTLCTRKMKTSLNNVNCPTNNEQINIDFKVTLIDYFVLVKIGNSIDIGQFQYDI